MNKLNTLRLAKSFGLKVPHTILAGLNWSFLRDDMSYITKSFSPDSMARDKNDSWWNIYTRDLEGSSISDFPQMIQEKILKDYEIRVFYFFQSFYSMAIFSQLNEKTSVDFRKYDFDKPNRRIPYNLPKSVESDLEKLLSYLGLNCASIDILVSNGDYIFLEINPVGQFGMVSYPCNYNLELKIANKLIELYEK